jgi:hypothetical protein
VEDFSTAAAVTDSMDVDSVDLVAVALTVAVATVDAAGVAVTEKKPSSLTSVAVSQSAVAANVGNVKNAAGGN